MSTSDKQSNCISSSFIQTLVKYWVIFLEHRITQIQLNAQLDIVAAVVRSELHKESQNDQRASNLEVHVKTLNNIKSKITVVSNILQTSQERLAALHQKVQLVSGGSI